MLPASCSELSIVRSWASNGSVGPRSRNQRIHSASFGVRLRPSFSPRNARIGDTGGNCAVEWQDLQDDMVLSTGPLSRRPKPRCMGGSADAPLITVSFRSGLVSVRTGFGLLSG